MEQTDYIEPAERANVTKGEVLPLPARIRLRPGESIWIDGVPKS